METNMEKIGAYLRVSEITETNNAYLFDVQAIKALGNRVRELREKKKLSIEQISNPDIHPTQWARIETGIANTTISYLTRIAKKLGVKPSELLD